MEEDEAAKGEAMEEDADASGGSDSDSSSDEDISPEAMERLMGLEAELEANINLYDKHVEYIELLRQLKLRVKLREAHERMATKFPLSEQLWVEWVNDELEMVRSAEDFDFVKALFRRATLDYLSVDVWVQYLEFMSELDPDVRGFTPEGAKAMRDLCEEALTAAGLHVTLAGKLWDIYRKYEVAVGAAATGSDADKQVERVRELYQRQLALPLVGNDELMKEYTEWEKERGQAVPAHVSKAASKAEEALALRTSYEEAVAAGKEPDAALLAAYLAYIKLEQAQGDPARVQVVYERAVAAFPLTVELWSQYVRWLTDSLKIPATAAAAAARATRNCYWSGPLWAQAIRAGELARWDVAALGRMRDDALAAGMLTQEDYMEVLLAHLDFLRRQLSKADELLSKADSTDGGGAGAVVTAPVTALREAFQLATHIMASYFPEQPDRTLRLPSYWAQCEAHLVKDLAAARKVWEDAVKTPLGKYCEPWSAYASMERSLRCVKEARGVYRRAYNKRYADQGHAYALCVEWLRFEREEGSAEEYAQALSKVGPTLDEAAAAAAATDAQAVANAQAAAKVVKNLSVEEMSAMRRQHDPNFKGAAAKPAAAGKKDKDGFQVPASRAPAAKRPNDAQGGDAEQAGKRARLQGPEAGGGPPPGQQQQQQQQQDEDMGEGHAGQQQQQAKPAPGGFVRYTDEFTVFVRGLPLGTTEEHLQEFFKDCGDIRSVRIPTFPDGQRRNFAYVDFKSDDSIKQAIAKDGASLPGTQEPLMIAKSAPPGKGGGGGRGRGGGRGGGGGGFGGDGGGRGWGGRGRGGGGGGFQGEQGRGGRGWGRGRGYQGEQGGEGGGGGRGRGYHGEGGEGGGRGRPAFGLGHLGRGRLEHPHRHLQVEGGGTGAPATADAAPKSNADFRAMLLVGKKQ